MDVVIDGISQTSNEQVDVKKATKIPWWIWPFIIASAVLVPIGGAIGAFLGIASAMFCLSFGRNTSVSTILKVLACLGTTVGAWVIYFLIVFFVI